MNLPRPRVGLRGGLSLLQNSRAAENVMVDIEPQPIAVSVMAPTPPEPVFRCEGKQHCSQMASCAEARFYLGIRTLRAKTGGLTLRSYLNQVAGKLLAE